MTRFLGWVIVLCAAAAACGASDTATGEGSGSDTADTTSTVLEPATDAGNDPAAAAGDATTTALEPVADRLPADPDAPAAEWVAGVNAAGWGFHRHLDGNAVSSPISIGTAFSLARAGASIDTGDALDEIFGFPDSGVHNAANVVDVRLAEASVGPTTLEVANRPFPDDGFSPTPASTASPPRWSSPPRSTAPR